MLFRSPVGKRVRSPSPTIGRTTRHTSLMTVRIHIAGEGVEAIVDSAASAPVFGTRLACRMGIWKSARKISVKQGGGSFLRGGNFIVNSSFKVLDSSHPLLGKFSLDAEVLDIG